MGDAPAEEAAAPAADAAPAAEEAAAPAAEEAAAPAAEEGGAPAAEEGGAPAAEEGAAPAEPHEEGPPGEEGGEPEKVGSLEKAQTDSKGGIQEQKSSKMSVSSLGKRQSGEDSKEGFLRRKSTRSIKNAVGSIVSFRRGSIAEYFDRAKAPKFANSYKLDPDKPFNAEVVAKILEEVLVEALDNLTYDADKVPKQAKWAASAIRAKVKEQEYDRYKFVTYITIGEKRSQDMFFAYRILFDLDRDKHATFWTENMFVFAIACCFGTYYE